MPVFAERGQEEAETCEKRETGEEKKCKFVFCMLHICICVFVYLYLCNCISVFAERGQQEAETCEEWETEDGQKCKSHVNLGSGHSGHCQ